MFPETIKNIHMIGIGGAGMSALAQMLVDLGFNVRGSDLEESGTVFHLRSLGVQVHIGHNPKNVDGADLVIYSTAISPNNCELKNANAKGIKVLSRPEVILELMRLKYTIAVTGTHGKTTTTAMIGYILKEANMDPTVIIGGKSLNFNSNAKVGKSKYLVVEVDESDPNFVKAQPNIAVVTNIDNDHCDNYGSMENLKCAFKKFINGIAPDGVAILCTDDENINSMIKDIKSRYLGYSIHNRENTYLFAKEISPNRGGYSFDVYMGGNLLGGVTLGICGEHNVKNALSSIAVAMELGVEFNRCAEILREVKGIARRLQLLGKKNGVLVIDDYAHHPTEIKVTLKTIRECIDFSGKLVVVFQPHRYSRTRLLYDEFGRAFDLADLIFVSDIYAASELPIEGISAKLIVDSLKKNKKDARYIKFDELLINLHKVICSGDVLLTLGAGNIWKIAQDYYNG